jgi:hypothetical protein
MCCDYYVISLLMIYRTLCRLSLLLYSRLNRPANEVSPCVTVVKHIIMQNEAEASIPTETAVREGPRQNPIAVTVRRKAAKRSEKWVKLRQAPLLPPR